MATPPPVSDDPAVEQHYLAQFALAAAVSEAGASLWASLEPMESAANLARFADGLFAVASQYAPVSASLAGDHYRNARRSAGVTQTVTLPPMRPLSRAQVDAGVEWATRERAEGDVTQVYAAILADMQAATEKAVLDAGRDMVVQAVEGDEKALGFRRVARPGACYWCLTLAFRSSTRGADRHYGVYKSRLTAGQLPADAGEVNRFHYRCRCTVEPVFSPAETIPGWLADMEALYSDATVDSEKGQLLNDFRRALRARRAGTEPPTPTPTALPTAKPDRDVANLIDALNAAMAA